MPLKHFLYDLFLELGLKQRRLNQEKTSVYAMCDRTFTRKDLREP